MEATLQEIKKLKVDALYGKKKHFNAADRKARYFYWLNIPVIVVNVLLGGSLIFDLLKAESPQIAKISAALFSFLAAAMVGISTFFNFSKQVEGHRKVGNKYLEVVKGCNRIIALYTDGLLEEQKLVKEFERLTNLNTEANRDAAAYQTSRGDYRKARKGIKEDGEEDYLDQELE